MDELSVKCKQDYNPSCLDQQCRELDAIFAEVLSSETVEDHPKGLGLI